MKATAELTTILTLLRQITSLDNVKSFFKERGLTHSAGSWDKFIDDRVHPAIEEGKLKSSELLTLLSELEESGKQHVFLYRISNDKAAELMDDKVLQLKAAAADAADLIDNPKVLDTPDTAALTSIRYEVDGNVKALIVKGVETRFSRKLIDDEVVGNMQTMKFEIVRERAVNVLKVFEDGRVEVRLGSKSNASHYLRELQRFWYQVRHFLQESDVTQVSLTKLKNTVWSERKELEKVMRFSSHTLRNDNGVTLKAATGSESDNLITDEGATESLDGFIKKDGYCDSSNFWMLKQENGIPSKDIHVLLSGAANEFAITQHCKKADYDYVIGKIRALSA